MPGIFISYRREDTGPWAVTLRDRLAHTFGDRQVFLDLDVLAPGDWRDQINRTLNVSRVVLVIIGRNWLSAADQHGRTRLLLEDDVHRGEVMQALTRNNVTIMPVLVDGVSMPSADDLPDELKALARYQATEIGLGATRRTVEMKKLVRQIEALTGQTRWKRLAKMALGISLSLGVVNTTVALNSSPIVFTFLALSAAALAFAGWVWARMLRERMKGSWPAVAAAGISLAMLAGSFVRLAMMDDSRRGSARLGTSTDSSHARMKTGG